MIMTCPRGMAATLVLETLLEPTIQDEVANGRLPVGYRMTEGEARQLERRLGPSARTEHRP